MSKAKTGIQPGRILVVDDSTTNLQLLTNLLTEHGYKVYPASDGELALEFVHTTLPDLILLDIRMPGMGGFEVCRRLKADERTCSIPIMFISILEDEGDKVKGFQAGAVDYITKPFQPEEVLARVGIHLRVRALTERLEQKVRERTEKLTIANQRLQEEITERRQAEEEVRQHLDQQKALLFMYQNMDTAPVRNIISFVVDRCVNLTGSAIGFVGLISDDDRQMEAHVWSEKVMENCPLNEPVAFPISEAGLWAEPIRQRRHIIVNDYRAPNPYKKGSPDGHLELSRFMGVPVIDQNRVVAVAGVANRREEYTESDYYKVSLLLEETWNFIKRRRAEEALQKSEEKYRALFEHVNEGFALHEIIVDDRGVPVDYRFLEINPAFEAMTGLERAKVIGKTVREILPGIEHDPADWIGRYGHVALTGEGANFENYAEPLGKWYQVNAFSPGTGYFAVTFTDITERKVTEDALHTLNAELDRRVLERTAELEAANKEMHDFTYTVSHDLRAPLRHIDGFMELLQQQVGPTLDEQGRHYMDAISGAAQKMGLLIDELLSFSRMGRHELTSMPVDLSAMVRDVVRVLEPETKGRIIRWRIAELPVVTGDRAMLRMVFVNLIANALKFTRTRQPTEIEIGCQPGEGEVVVFVRDNGVGFDMQYADKLFGVFQRLHRMEDFEGIGIGLANVRRIITRHGGRTWAEGAVDHGATLYFSLPRSVTGV